MAFIKLLLYTKRDWIVAAVLSLLTGIGRAALVAIISQEVTYSRNITYRFIYLFLLLTLVILSTEWFANRKIIEVGAQVIRDLQVRLTYQVLQAPIHWVETTGFARVIAAVGTDIRTVALGVNQLPKIIVGGPVTIGCLLYLAWLSPFALGVLVLFMAPFMLILAYLIRKAKSIVRSSYYIRDRQYQAVEALVRGSKELRLSHDRAAAFMADRVVFSTDGVRDADIRFRKFFAVNLILSNGIYFVFILAVFALIALDQVSVEILAGYVVVLLYMRSSVLAIMGSVPYWSQANVALQKIDSLGFSIEDLMRLERPPEPSPPSPLPVSLPFEITLSGATHHYTREQDDAPFILGPIDLTFRSGELVFIVGHNGSGKTTLLKLLLGLYAPEQGTLLLNGGDVDEGSIRGYQNLFSAVFADFYLFTELFGLSLPEQEERAIYYLERLQLQDKVSITNGVLSTINLSSGQRKRLALLVAYIEDRPILVFDEWAESQDPEFTRVFYEEILPDLRNQGKLVIVISHDEQYFSVGDRLIELESGQVKGVSAPSR